MPNAVRPLPLGVEGGGSRRSLGKNNDNSEPLLATQVQFICVILLRLHEDPLNHDFGAPDTLGPPEIVSSFPPFTASLNAGHLKCSH